jgi:hypothetical protein
VTLAASAQQPVKERKLLGDWQLVIEIDEAMAEAKQELRDEDDVLGSLFLGAIDGLVSSVIENIDVVFTFLPDGELEINVEAMGEKETEYALWKINDKGQLIIEGLDEDDDISIDEVDYWLMEGNKLYSFDEDDDEAIGEKKFYMTRIE